MNEDRGRTTLDEQPIRRYDLRQIGRFHCMLRRQPALAILLAGLPLLAGAAMLLGWGGLAPEGTRRWIGPLLWWLFAAYVGVTSLGGWFSCDEMMRRGND